MKRTEKKEVKRIEEYLVEFKCDLCGKEGDRFSEQWSNENYSIEDTIVSYKTGTAYPDGGSHKIYSFDICNECFQRHIINYFKTVHGIEPRIEEDWF